MKYNILDKTVDMRPLVKMEFLEATIRRYESLLEHLDAELARCKAEIAMRAPVPVVSVTDKRTGEEISRAQAEYDALLDEIHKPD